MRARVLWFLLSRRRRDLLSAKAERQAHALAATIDPERDVSDAFILGMFHWLRYSSLPPGADHEDFAAAARYLAPVYREDPRRVPTAMRGHLGRYARWRQTPGDGPEERRARGLALIAEYKRGGSPARLGDAVGLLRAAVSGVPGDDADRAEFLADYGAGLRLLSEVTTDERDLAEAIGAHRAARAAAAPADPNRAGYDYNLAVSLAAAYERSGDGEALDEAIALFRSAAEAAPGGALDRASALAGLAAGLTMQAERSKDHAWFDEAVRAHRDALAASAPGDPDLASRWSNLGSALHAMYLAEGDESLLMDAVQAHRSAVKASEAWPADRAGHLANLAATLAQLAEETGRADLMAEAATAGREAVDTAAGPDPRRAEYLFNLAYMLQALGKEPPDCGLIAEAVRCLAEVSENTAARARVRISACQLLAHLAGEPQWAADAMEAAVALLSRAVPSSLSRRDSEHQLGLLAGIAGDAAAAAIGAGRLERAVELLEQTRGFLVADALNARGSDLAAVAGRFPDLARDYREAQARLDAPARRFPPAHTREERHAGDLLARQAAAELDRQAASEALDQAIGRIRAVGWPGFLRVPHVDELAAAIGGPVVFVVAGLDRCDALILRPGGSPAPELVPLGGLTKAEAFRQAASFATAQVTATHPDATPGEQREAEAGLLTVLGWAWDAIAEPVLNALGCTAPAPASGDWPRVWWCPVGALAFLPLHAAGHHLDLTSADPALAASPRTVLDRVVSSYAITLRALAHARTRQPGRDTGSLLVVSVPDAPDLAALEQAHAEAAEIAGMVAGARLLSGSGAARDNVLTALAGHAIAHFACHAYADMTDPGASALVLSDYRVNPLSVRDISGLRLDGALAYLSACETGRTVPELTDEAVHITGAFHLAGYQHVIGTLWPVRDSYARAVAVEVYRRLTRGRTTPPDAALAAYSLHHAVRALRDKQPHAPSAWAGYTHTGP